VETGGREEDVKGGEETKAEHNRKEQLCKKI
jgi:hypothetical protein